MKARDDDAPADTTACELLAVYGTLLGGLEPLRGAPRKAGKLEFVGPCRIEGQLFDCGAYPALVPRTHGADEVVGELYRLAAPDALDELDRYEDFDPADPAASLFVRVRVRLVEPPVDAWVYIGGTARRLCAIPGGDWRRWREDKNVSTP